MAKKKVHVRSHIRNVNGKRVRVEEHTRSPPGGSFSSSSSSGSSHRGAREPRGISVGEYPGIEYSDTTTGEWNEPDLEDYGYGSEWDQMTEREKRDVASHYLANTGGSYPPEDFGDLKLPIVEPDGDLSKHAVDNSDARLNQVHGLSDEERKGVQKEINRIQREVFNE